VTAITEAPESLDWVRFSDGEDERCAAQSVDCSAQAVAVAFYRVTCRCALTRQPLCVMHRDAVAELVATRGPYCRCRTCHADALLLRIEPIR
jgi:hypothetical protein